MSATSPRRRILITTIGFLVLALFVSGVVVYITKAPSAECPVIPATQQDFDEAAAVGEGVFEPDMWRFDIGEHPALISVGWFDDAHEALAHSQYILYNCGYTEADVDKFYSEDGLEIMLGGYDSWEQTAMCEQDDVTLSEFDVVYVGRPYIVRYWVQPVNDKRVRDIRLDFAAEDVALMDEYAARLFPAFTTCTV